jgi:hypothetical protein
VCDLTARLLIDLDAAMIYVIEGPRGSCDAAAVGRGVVLTFAPPLDPDALSVGISTG